MQCLARPVDSKNQEGKRSHSKPVSVSVEKGMCQRTGNEIGAEPYRASISYTGVENAANLDQPLDPKMFNLVKIKVEIPHLDGMLPIVSTRPLNSFSSILTRSPLRLEHQCSNIIDPVDSVTDYNFIRNKTIPTEKTDIASRNMNPHQFNDDLRSELTLNFYQALNLHSCMWVFEAYFNMTELVRPDICGGQGFSDGSVLNMTSSFGSVKVPLYVSQLYSSLLEWQSFNQQTDLILRYTYQNSQMYSTFVGNDDMSANSLNIQVISASITPAGKFIVKFKTRAMFRGKFVIPSKSQLGDLAPFKTITNLDKPMQEFTLKLVDQDRTYDKPTQVWQFESVFSHRDFAGNYLVNLSPCSAANADILWEDSEIDNCVESEEPVPNQTIRLNFQQVNDPIAAKYRLNTEFLLLSHEDDYINQDLSPSNMTTDVAFPENAPIFGRVMISGKQKMGEQFTVQIEKVFLCAGKGNYVPKFDPTQELYGCLTSTKVAPLEHRFKILDKESPESVDTNFNGIKFNAKFAADDVNAAELVNFRGSDGFRLDSEPLFDVELGTHWYLHTIYKVIQGESRIRRHSVSSSHAARNKREIRPVNFESELDMVRLGKDVGTNIQFIRLNRGTSFIDNAGFFNITHGYGTPLLAIIGSILICVVIVLFILVRRKRKTTVVHVIGNSHASSTSSSDVAHSLRGSAHEEFSSRKLSLNSRNHVPLSSSHFEERAEFRVRLRLEISHKILGFGPDFAKILTSTAL